jgi:hypothetical protein
MIPEHVGVAHVACSTSIDLCRETSRILNTLAPRRAALRAKNGRRNRPLSAQARGIVLDEIVCALIGEAFGAEPAAFGNAALSGRLTFLDRESSMCGRGNTSPCPRSRS